MNENEIENKEFMKFEDLEINNKSYEISELVMMEEHLQHNFIPPFSRNYAKYLIGMIKKINTEELNLDDEVVVNDNGDRMTIYDLIEKFHLEQMINNDILEE